MSPIFALLSAVIVSFNISRKMAGMLSDKLMQEVEPTNRRQVT